MIMILQHLCYLFSCQLVHAKGKWRIHTSNAHMREEGHERLMASWGRVCRWLANKTFCLRDEQFGSQVSVPYRASKSSKPSLAGLGIRVLD
jgi:hypothetical protein